MADFESLNISITANADSASNSINSLVQSLGGLRQALSSFSVDKGLERSLGSITTVVNGLNSAASSLNVSGFKDIGTGVSAFSNSLSELNGALSTIDSKSFTSASRSITKLFGSLSQTAPQDISLAISNISALSTAMTEMQGMMENVDGKSISGFARRLTTLSIGLSNLSSAEVSSDSIRGISDGIISITQAVDTISDESLERIEKLSASLSQLARVANATPSMDIRIPDMGGAGGGGRARGNSRVTAFANSYADSLKKNLGTSLRLAGRGATETMRGLSSALHELYNGFGLGHIGSMKFLSSLARIATYRFIRTVIKSITDGIKTGLQNIAHYSAEANAALSQLSTGSLYLKNSLGAALYPAISSLIGIFSSLVGVVVRALNVLNMLFSLLGGKGTYIRATKQTKDFTKATGAAGGAAKALKQELMGFDEINALSPDGGGGGGGGGGGLDYGGMFETVPIEGWMKDMLAKMDFSPLGQRIADKINTALGKIKWQDVQTGAKNIGHAIATAINGFFIGEEGIKGKDGIDANLVASAIAGVINSAAGLIATFWEDTNWEQIGAKIKWTLVQALNKIDTNMLGRAITGKLRAMIRFAKGWLTGEGKGFFATLGTKIGQTLNSALASISASDLAKAITGLIGDAADGAQNFLTSADFDLVADKVNQFLGTAITTMPFGKVSDAIVTVINKAAKFFNLKATQDNISAIAGKVAKFLHDCIIGIKWDEVGKALGGIVTAIAQGVSDALKSAGEEGKSPIREAVEGFLSSIDVTAIFNLIGVAFNTSAGKIIEIAAIWRAISMLVPKDVKTTTVTSLIFSIDALFEIIGSIGAIKEDISNGADVKASIAQMVGKILFGAAGVFVGWVTGGGITGASIGFNLGVRLFTTIEDVSAEMGNFESDVAKSMRSPNGIDGLSYREMKELQAQTEVLFSDLRFNLQATQGTFDSFDVGLATAQLGNFSQQLSELLGLDINNDSILNSINVLIPGFTERLTSGEVTTQEFTDALSLLGTELQNQIGREAWEEYIQQLGLVSTESDSASTAVTDAASTIASATDGMSETTEKLVTNIDDLSDSSGELKNIADDMPDVIMIDGSSMDGVKKSATEASNAVGGLTSFIVMIQKKLNEFTGSFQPLADSASNANETAGTLKETISEIPVRKVTAFSMIGADTARKQVQKIKDALSGISSKTISIKVNAGLTAGAKSFLKELKAASDTATKATINNLLKFSQFANGGFPKSGELFMANENGRQELVGRIGSKPAVANQDQIGEAIFRYMDAHSAQSGDGINTDELAAAIVRGIKASGLGVVNIGDRQIANAINRETVRSGKPAIQF